MFARRKKSLLLVDFDNAERIGAGEGVASVARASASSLSRRMCSYVMSARASAAAVGARNPRLTA